MTDPKKLPVLSLKGRTGKTTVCLGLAEALRDSCKRVGLLDIDIHASALPRAIDIQKEPISAEHLCKGAKTRAITSFSMMSLGPTRMANYHSEFQATTYRALDPSNWSHKWSAKMTE